MKPFKGKYARVERASWTQTITRTEDGRFACDCGRFEKKGNCQHSKPFVEGTQEFPEGEDEVDIDLGVPAPGAQAAVYVTDPSGKVRCWFPCAGGGAALDMALEKANSRARLIESVWADSVHHMLSSIMGKEE